MSKLKCALLVLTLPALVMVTGCSSVIEVRAVTKTATPESLTPTPTVVAVATAEPSPTPTREEVTPTATPIPQPTSTPIATATSVPPVVTRVPPASTPSSPTRIQFAPGAASATLTGYLWSNAVDRYVLRALAGQTMEVMVTSPNSDVLLSIWGADGTVLKRHVDGGAYWADPLPATQDYYIEVLSSGGATSYALTVRISPLEPEATRIQFPPGTSSTTLTGHVEERDIDRYVLRALAGQTMEVVITSPNNDVLLTIVGADGVPLKRYVDGSAEWRGQLYATQDYFIEAVSVGGGTNYQLAVWISPLGPPQPTRIQFAPGTTSAVVEGSLAPGEADRYVLRALRGQMMEIHVPSAGTLYLNIGVEGQDGSVWSAPPGADLLRIEALPATQDYIISLMLPTPLRDPVNYTMEVQIPAP